MLKEIAHAPIRAGWDRHVQVSALGGASEQSTFTSYSDDVLSNVHS